ncbi:peroxynitrite isomerase THAP4 [Anabrus simplex]|uniref:peroxynitrite isomerase THAP4 n=1 Tax=Anabrus simplex TaxID=316456 RepID=UPI0034DCC70C
MTCSALNCKSKWTKGSRTAFHNFPIKNEVLCNKWLIAMRRSNWKPTSTSRLCSDHFKPSCFRMSNGRKVLIEGSVPSIFDFPHNVRSRSPSRRSSPRKRGESPLTVGDYDEDPRDTPTTNSTDVTLQITSDHNYCPQSVATFSTTPTSPPTNVKLQIRTDDHNYCPTTLTKLVAKPAATSTNVKLHISRALSADHNYCPSTDKFKSSNSSSTAVTLRIRSDAAAPDHNYHCPQTPNKMVKRLKVSEDKCLILSKKLKVARQKIRRQSAKIISLQKTIAGLAQRLCPITGIEIQDSHLIDKSNI